MRAAMVEVILEITKLSIATSHDEKMTCRAPYESLRFVDWKHESRTDNSGERYLILQEDSA